MSAPSDDDTDFELSKYAPKWSRQQPATRDPERPRPVNTVTTVPSLREEYPDRRLRSLRPEPVPEPPARREDGLLAIGRMALAAVAAAVVVLLAIFGKPILQRVAVLEPDSPPAQVSKPSNRLTANDATANRTLVPAAGIAAAPVAASPATAQTQQVPPSPAPGQQAALSPTSKPLGQESGVNSAVRG